MTCPGSCNQQVVNLSLKARSDSLSSSGLPGTKEQLVFQQVGMGQGEKARMNNMTKGTNMGMCMRVVRVKVVKLCWGQNIQALEV